MEDILEKLEWEGNSQAMYGVILKAVPEILRGGVKKLAAAWVVNHNVQVVTEDIVFKVVDDITPSSAKNKLLPVLMQMKSRKEEKHD